MFLHPHPHPMSCPGTQEECCTWLDRNPRDLLLRSCSMHRSSHGTRFLAGSFPDVCETDASLDVVESSTTTTSSPPSTLPSAPPRSAIVLCSCRGIGRPGTNAWRLVATPASFPSPWVWTRSLPFRLDAGSFAQAPPWDAAISSRRLSDVQRRRRGASIGSGSASRTGGACLWEREMASWWRSWEGRSRCQGKGPQTSHGGPFLAKKPSA